MAFLWHSLRSPYVSLIYKTYFYTAKVHQESFKTFSLEVNVAKYPVYIQPIWIYLSGKLRLKIYMWKMFISIVKPYIS